MRTPVDVPALLAAVQEMIGQKALPNMLAQARGSGARLLAPLPASIARRLTVMREQRSELFQHSHPARSDPDHKVVGVQRKHMVAHPITAMLMMRNTQAYPKRAEAANARDKGPVNCNLTASGRSQPDQITAPSTAISVLAVASPCLAWGRKDHRDGRVGHD